MSRINDKDGVDIVIGPVKGKGALHLNVDLNFAFDELEKLNNRAKDWDLNIMWRTRPVARARFAAFQFMADGIERRTISMKFLEVEKRWRGKKKTYDVAAHIVDVVTRECDAEWGPVPGLPVMFVEKRHLTEVAEKERGGIIAFFVKITAWALGLDKEEANIPESDLVVSVVGDDISLQLVRGHLIRSERFDQRQ